MPDVIEAQKLTKAYAGPGGSVDVLRSVDLNVAGGELMLLVGPSGCGKTTLISILAGMLHPTSGALRVLGTYFKNLSAREMADFRGKNIGMVFQELHLFPALSATENAALPLLAAGCNRSHACRMAHRLLESLGLASRASAPAKRLSGGERQRVALARAVIHDPPLVICDEPTSALDRETGLGLMALLRQVIVDKGHTAIVVTHDPRLLAFADRIAFMEDGRINRVENSQGAAWHDHESLVAAGRGADGRNDCARIGAPGAFADVA